MRCHAILYCLIVDCHNVSYNHNSGNNNHLLSAAPLNSGPRFHNFPARPPDFRGFAPPLTPLAKKERTIPQSFSFIGGERLKVALAANKNALQISGMSANLRLLFRSLSVPVARLCGSRLRRPPYRNWHLSGKRPSDGLFLPRNGRTLDSRPAGAKGAVRDPRDRRSRSGGPLKFRFYKSRLC